MRRHLCFAMIGPLGAMTPAATAMLMGVMLLACVNAMRAALGRRQHGID